MVKHGADTMMNDYLKKHFNKDYGDSRGLDKSEDVPDESNLQTFPFSCCNKCPYPEPTCQDTCGKYACERDEHIRKDERKRIVKLLEPFEWSGLHTDYDDSWAVMTRSCPLCFNAKKDGHKPKCLFVELKGEL